MSDLDDLDELKAMLEAYLELDDHRAVKQLINRIKKRIERIVQEMIL